MKDGGLTPSFELEMLERVGYEAVIGIDEVGRGCIAGPVFVCGYLFSTSSRVHHGVNDSKRLSRKRRELIFSDVDDSEYVLKYKSARQIDSLGIVECIVQCINEIYQELRCRLEDKDVLVLIDGAFREEFDFDHQTIVKGDSGVYSIAMASVIAKVCRDAYMFEVAKMNPMYGWESNKGYGTRKHFESIDRYGFSDQHRLSFLNIGQ